MPTPLPKWTFIAAFAVAVLSFLSIQKRAAVEGTNRTVAIVAEGDTLEALAAGEGFGQTLAQLKARGLRGVVLSDETIGEMISEGRARIVEPSLASPNLSGGKVLEVTPDLRKRVVRGLRIRAGSTPSGSGNRIALGKLPVSLVRATSIGLNPDQCRIARSLGLTIVARTGNPAGVSSRAVTETLAWLKELGASGLLAQGDQVIGRRDALKTTISEIERLGLVYYAPEFAKIGGDANVVEAIPERVVRLHSAQIAELDRLTLPDAVERYVKAARERNMRVLLVRPLSLSADQPLKTFGDFVEEIAVGLTHDGLHLGDAKPFQDSGVPRWLTLALGAAIAAAFAGLATGLLTNPQARSAAWLVSAAVAAAGLTKTGQQGQALLAAISFPFLAFVLLDRWRPANPILGFWGISAVSLVGGLAVAGLLNGLPYFVVADEFRGIKLAVFFPILLVGAWYFRSLTDWRRGLADPLTWGTTALSFFLAVAFAFMIARTGNDTGAGASGLEMQFRNLLDQILFVRPRTKEFLVGHPALIVGIGMLHRYGRTRSRFSGGTVLVLMVGAVGQTSIVNTLCHLHIPVMLSLGRILLGMVAGTIIGGVAWAIIGRILPKEVA